MSARNETPHTVLKTLGQKKCNGSWDASTENLTIQQVIEVSETKKDKLTGATQKARALEVMGTCVSMRVSVEGCLLYTSPSPRDGLLSRMPSSA